MGRKSKSNQSSSSQNVSSNQGVNSGVGLNYGVNQSGNFGFNQGGKPEHWRVAVIWGQL